MSIDFLYFCVYTTPKNKTGQRMEVSQKHNSMYNFGKRPTIFAFGEFLRGENQKNRFVLKKNPVPYIIPLA